ncbi:MAG TPA: Hpt domain-containing protein [Bacteroidales bacterium]|nr:Hpt domain-containing protein [Bacteroidales bacterium]
MKTINKAAFIDTFQYFDKHVVLEIIDIFINECDSRIDAMRNDIANNNLTALKFDAHSFKGVVANFMAEETLGIARELEYRATEGKNEGLDDLLNSLEQSSSHLLADLKELRNLFID